MLLAGLAAWFAAIAAPALAQAPAPAPVAMEVEVVRDGDSWTAEMRFLRDAPVWVFVRSALTREGERPWRPQSWTVETRGVRLERRGRYDVLVAANGGDVPRRVRVRFMPFSRDLIADYDPALVFTDGSVALYSEQFDAFPYESASAAARLPIDLAATDVPLSRTRATFRDAGGRVLHAGRRVSAVTIDDDDGSYILFGPLQPAVTDAMTAIVDPRLPAWIRGALERSVPDILARYTRALGPAPGPRPTIIVSWAGPTPGVTSMGGSVLPGIITMAYEGAGVLQETPQARSYGLWFIAHESAHFWLGQAVRYQYSREAWIFEGGADLIAFRTVAEVDPGYDWRGALNQAIADCAALATDRGVASAEDRNEQRAYYACGAVFGLIAEAASGRPFIVFIRDLIDANRADRIINRAEWLAALDRVSDDRSLSRDIALLLDRGAADPKATIAGLFRRAGVRFARGEDGMPRLR
jgi:hypothetical protein